MNFKEIYEKYGNKNIILPFRQCWFCENIEDCPHPTVNEKGKPIPPKECERKDDIILEKREL